MAQQLHTQNELKALVSLLDDPDNTVQVMVQGRLKELGRRALPFLQEAQNKADSELQQRIGQVMQDLHFTEIEQHWKSIMRMPNAELEHGAFLLALHRFPNLSIRSYQAKLDAMAERIRPKVELQRVWVKHLCSVRMYVTIWDSEAITSIIQTRTTVISIVSSILGAVFR